VKNPARLLYVVNDTPYFVLHWLERAIAARDHGFETHVAGSAGDGVADIEAAGLPFHAVPFTRGKSDLGKEVAAFRALPRLYASVRPDLIHHVTIKPVIYGSVAARWRGVPAVVNTVPGLGYVFAQSGLRAAIDRLAVKTMYRTALGHRNSRVIFENPDDRADFIRWGLISDAQGLLIKGAGVDLDRFRPAAVPPSGPPLVVFAARMLWDKGVGVFVDAAAAVKKAHPDARLVLVGTGDPGSHASVSEDQLRAWSESGLVEWWGRRSDMPDVLASAAVVCLPSFYREGIPRVLIETAACGRPAITSDAPGCREIVRDGENGLLVPLRDPARLAAAIIRLLDDPALATRMGAAGRARAEAEFGSPRVIARTLAVYDELLAHAASDRGRAI
jgi:glycosyltransferase involved in cell wall biosynthesis